MTARLFELFESSLERIQGTVFHTQKIQQDFMAFRHSINRSLTADRINFNMTATIILKYSKLKYRGELEKLKRFLMKIESGVDVDFRQYYLGAEGYDSDKSPDKQERDASLKKRNNQIRRPKEISKPKDKKQLTKYGRFFEKDESPRQSKTATINKIMKLYNVLDPSKTQFLEDMIYNEPEEVHRTKLMNSLWEKNRAIDEQMKEYHKKVEFAADKIKEIQKEFQKPLSDCEGGSDHHSGGQRGKSNMFRSEVNIKANSFIISKPKKQSNNFMLRKSRRQLLLEDQPEHQTDFIVNSAGQYSSGAEYASDTGMQSGAVTDRHTGKDTKQGGVRRPATKSLLKRAGMPSFASPQRPVSRDESRKQTESHMAGQQLVSKGSTKNRIFVVKSPTLFQDQNLHSRMVVNTGRVINKKQPDPRLNKSIRGRPSNTRMSRSVLAKDQKFQRIDKTIQETIRVAEHPKQIFPQKTLKQESMIFDPEKFKQLGGKKQFNLRMKKHMKKSIMVSDRLFIEQTNEQINLHNL